MERRFREDSQSVNTGKKKLMPELDMARTIINLNHRLNRNFAIAKGGYYRKP